MATDTMIDTSALRPVLIICDVGLVRDVLNLQPGQEYELFDADVLENGGSEAADYWDDLNEEMRAVALDRYENWATEARRLSGLRKTGPDYQARRERIEALVNAHGGAAAIGNGYEIPEKPLRYLGIEWRGPDLIWAYSADTLVRLKHCIDNSETARDKVGMVDLDTGDQYQAVLKVFDFAKLGG